MAFLFSGTERRGAGSGVEQDHAAVLRSKLAGGKVLRESGQEKKQEQEPLARIRGWGTPPCSTTPVPKCESLCGMSSAHNGVNTPYRLGDCGTELAAGFDWELWRDAGGDRDDQRQGFCSDGHQACEVQ